MAVINLQAGNFLALQQNETGQPDNINQVINQSLTISQVVRCSDQLINSNQFFNVLQNALTVNTLNISASNYLQLAQLMGPTKYLVTNNTIQLTQVGANVNIQILGNNLSIAQTTLASFNYFNSLVIAQAVSPVLDLIRTFTQPLVLHSFVAVFKTDGVNTYAITTPVPVQPNAIVLTCGSQSVTLRIPEIGDSDKIEIDRVQEQTRGGDLIIFRDATWPTTEILKYKITNLLKSQVTSLLNFFQTTVGLSVTLLDYQGIVWNGIILTPDAEVICTGDFNCGSYDVEFEFQGQKT